MSVQTVRPSALPLPKSLSSSAPSVASSATASGTSNSKAATCNERVRAGSITPPSSGPRSTIPVLYNHRSIAMIPRVATAGLPHKNSHKTVGILNGNATSINIKKPLNSPTSQPQQSYWRFGQSKAGINMTTGNREIVRRHSARASSVSGGSGNVTPQQSSPVTALRKISNSSSTTDSGSRKVSTCSTDSNVSSYGRKISSDSNGNVTSVTKSHRKPVIGANSFGSADNKTKKRKSFNSDINGRCVDLQLQINKHSSTSKNECTNPGSNQIRPNSNQTKADSAGDPVNNLESPTELVNVDSVMIDVPRKNSSEESQVTVSAATTTATSVETKPTNSTVSEVTPNSGPVSSTSTTITVKTKGKERLETCLSAI